MTAESRSVNSINLNASTETGRSNEGSRAYSFSSELASEEAEIDREDERSWVMVMIAGSCSSLSNTTAKRALNSASEPPEGEFSVSARSRGSF